MRMRIVTKTEKGMRAIMHSLWKVGEKGSLGNTKHPSCGCTTGSVCPGFEAIEPSGCKLPTGGWLGERAKRANRLGGSIVVVRLRRLLDGAQLERRDAPAQGGERRMQAGLWHDGAQAAQALLTGKRGNSCAEAGEQCLNCGRITGTHRNDERAHRAAPAFGPPSVSW